MKLNECYSIPDHLLAELRDYDPAIRVRWGKAEKLVRVERKVSRTPVMAPPLETGDNITDRQRFDDYETFRDGCMLVFKFLPIEHLYPLIIYNLVRTDIQRLGGARAVADDLEARELYDKTRRTWNRRDDFRVMGRELYRHMNTIKTCPEGAGHKAYGNLS